MTKREIVVEVANQVDLPQALVKRVFELSLESIVNALANGDRVELRDFGVFKVKERKSRMGRNPRTGEVVPVAKKQVAHFKSGKILKERVN